jgi:hypothetical protein
MEVSKEPRFLSPPGSNELGPFPGVGVVLEKPRQNKGLKYHPEFQNITPKCTGFSNKQKRLIIPRTQNE